MQRLAIYTDRYQPLIVLPSVHPRIVDALRAAERTHHEVRCTWPEPLDYRAAPADPITRDTALHFVVHVSVEGMRWENGRTDDIVILHNGALAERMLAEDDIQSLRRRVEDILVSFVRMGLEHVHPEHRIPDGEMMFGQGSLLGGPRGWTNIEADGGSWMERPQTRARVNRVPRPATASQYTRDIVEQMNAEGRAMQAAQAAGYMGGAGNAAGVANGLNPGSAWPEYTRLTIPNRSFFTLPSPGVGATAAAGSITMAQIDHLAAELSGLGPGVPPPEFIRVSEGAPDEPTPQPADDDQT